MKAPVDHSLKPPDSSAHKPDRTLQPHVVSDRTSRILKAQKIISIVGSSRLLRCRRILEIGCGSGLIASTLSEAGTNDLSVDAVDVVDSRVEKRGYRFNLVDGTALPFENGAFDLVITNHVIEHVGDESEQLAHLSEVKRVTADHGIIYFAVPNKWRLVEPHYHLPLLSWFPRNVSDTYLRLIRRTRHYDCFPRSRNHFIRLFEATGLTYTDRTVAAIRQMLALEHPAHIGTRIVNSLCPDWLLNLGRPVVPTFVFLLSHPDSRTESHNQTFTGHTSRKG